MSTVIATVTYAGSILNDQITTSPWSCSNVQFPQRGAIPYLPQFEQDVLQPKNVDGARYRIGGAHFPEFAMLTVIAAADYDSAQIIARETELCKGDIVYVVRNGVSRTCQVINCTSVASGSRVLGATAFSSGDSGIPGGTPTAGQALASVDTMWTLQVRAQ